MIISDHSRPDLFSSSNFDRPLHVFWTQVRVAKSGHHTPVHK